MKKYKLYIIILNRITIKKYYLVLSVKFLVVILTKIFGLGLGLGLVDKQCDLHHRQGAGKFGMDIF